MFRTPVIFCCLVAMMVAEGQTSKKHRDYVPDEKTALRIAEAVLIAQYGEESVNAKRPLRTDSSNRDYWIVQLVGPQPIGKGGGPAVWINRYSGCLNVMDRMK